MSVKSVPLQVSMKGGCQIENITTRVQQALTNTGIGSGIATVFVKHTTASVMIIEDEPGIRADTGALWDRLVPADRAWEHNTRNPGEDNAHSHLRAQMQGASVTIPFNNGALTLGTWQQLVIVDFDTRARTRDLVVQVIGDEMK
ncbi:MAG: secondary thiamine-phosphate synthase enzyme YjbQ [Nitrospiraceae bacterium]